MPNNCIKCDSDKELSVKYRTKRGVPRYICRTCRRNDYALNKNVWKSEDPEETRRIRWVITWDMIAKEINERIMLKYKYEKTRH